MDILNKNGLQRIFELIKARIPGVATDSTPGLVKSGGDITIGTDGIMTLDGNRETPKLTFTHDSGSDPTVWDGKSDISVSLTESSAPLNAAVYATARDLSAGNATKVDDKDCSHGIAWKWTTTSATKPILAWRFNYLVYGTYALQVRLKMSSITDANKDKNVLEVQVFYNGDDASASGTAENRLGALVIKPSMFDAADTYKTFSVPFEHKNLRNTACIKKAMYVHVQSLATAPALDVSIDYVGITSTAGTGKNTEGVIPGVATDTTLGLVKGGGDVIVNSDGTMSVSGGGSGLRILMVTQRAEKIDNCWYAAISLDFVKNHCSGLEDFNPYDGVYGAAILSVEKRRSYGASYYFVPITGSYPFETDPDTAEYFPDTSKLYVQLDDSADDYSDFIIIRDYNEPDTYGDGSPNETEYRVTLLIYKKDKNDGVQLIQM